MDKQILHLVDGAKRATGLVVVIDVFRACTVEAYLANANAKTIMVTGDLDVARAYKQTNPSCVLMGERKGKIVDGFDFGNSPSQIEHTDFSGKTVVHTTSAGTQGFANATQGDEVIGASLTNAKAVAQYIKKQNPPMVSFVCMGLEAKVPTDEDTLCAEYIISLLEDQKFDIQSRIERLKITDGAKFFDATQQDVFPERDFHLATTLNQFNFVLKCEKEEGSPLMTMKKINVY